MEPIKVVLRYTNGAILRGYARDIHPHRSTIHLYEDPQGTSKMEVGVDGLKALFVVKSFEGDPYHRERKEFVEGDQSCGDKVEVTFGDGEVMQGSSVGYHPEQPGFFLLPPDSKGNNILVLAALNAVKDFRYL